MTLDQALLVGWLVVPVLVAMVIPLRSALAGTSVFGWLILPPAATVSLAGVPDLSKVSALAIAAAIACLVCEPRVLGRIRFSLIDCALGLWCVVPVASSLANGLGIYDGMSASLARLLAWGVPYLIGRSQFGDRDGMVVLTRAWLIGGVLYMPLCWLELRLSPLIHYWTFGYQQHVFAQHVRGDGYRPMVFLQHGLAVSWWLAATALLSIGQLRISSGLLRDSSGTRNVTTLLLAGTVVLCKSLGSILLVAVYAASFALSSSMRRAVVIASAAGVILLIGARIAGWDGGLLVDSARNISPTRARSLEFRVVQEEALLANARNRIWLGWGGWSRGRGEQEDLVTDSLWIIALTTSGVVGLGALLVWQALVLWVATRSTSIPFGCTLVFLMYMVDSVANALDNPIAILLGGSLLSYGLSVRGRESV